MMMCGRPGRAGHPGGGGSCGFTRMSIRSAPGGRGGSGGSSGGSGLPGPTMTWRQSIGPSGPGIGGWAAADPAPTTAATTEPVNARARSPGLRPDNGDMVTFSFASTPALDAAGDVDARRRVFRGSSAIIKEL